VYILTAKFCGKIPSTKEIITSNEQFVQIAIYDEEVGTPLIATNFKGGDLMQYSQFSMQYMIVDQDTVTTVNPLIYYGMSYSKESATLNEINNWAHTFTLPGVYDIAIQYGEIRSSLGALNVLTY
jgi:hypothetical protein